MEGNSVAKPTNHGSNNASDTGEPDQTEEASQQDTVITNDKSKVAEEKGNQESIRKTMEPIVSNTPAPTHSQKLQIRAQILVFGALLKGTAPQESYMDAAFSMPEGGGRIWEASLMTYKERLENQVSKIAIP